MKLYLLCAVSAAAVFIAGMTWQATLFDDPATDEDADKPGEVAAVKAKTNSRSASKQRIRFPQDLAPAAQAHKVEPAAAFTPGPDPHKMAMMKPDGTLHEWHESIPDEWRAYKVQETELVVVVGTQKKIFVDQTNFQNGPPIRRYIFEVTVSVVEPKVGRVVGYKTFRQTPRPIQPWEAYEKTMIGRAVSWSFVFNWVASMTRIGFPEEIDTSPLVREAEI
jgi:hypothetical protein